MDTWKKITIGLLIALSPALWAASTPTGQIARTAQQFLTQHYAKTAAQPPKIYVGPVDPHLSLPACHKSLQAFLPNDADPFTTQTVGVRCPETTGWTIYVPVRTTLEGQAYSLSHPVTRDTTLTQDDVTAVNQDPKSFPRGYVNNLTQIVGKVARRDLPQGAIITQAALRNPILIQRGDMVTIQVQEPTLTVRMNGQAQNAAAQGDSVTVQNLSSHRQVTGVVNSDKTVNVSA